MPDLVGHTALLRRELMMNRIAQRLAVREETLWARLKDLQASARKRADLQPRPAAESTPRATPAAAHEAELMQVLLAEPALVPVAMDDIRCDEVENGRVRQILDALYELQADGTTPDVDQLREVVDDADLISRACRARDIGRHHADRPGWLAKIIEEFRKRRAQPRIETIRNQLHAAGDDAEKLELLRQLQDQADVRI
jgi:DNA primase